MDSRIFSFYNKKDTSHKTFKKNYLNLYAQNNCNH